MDLKLGDIPGSFTKIKAGGLILRAVNRLFVDFNQGVLVASGTIATIRIRGNPFMQAEFLVGHPKCTLPPINAHWHPPKARTDGGWEFNDVANEFPLDVNPQDWMKKFLEGDNMPPGVDLTKIQEIIFPKLSTLFPEHLKAVA